MHALILDQFQQDLAEILLITIHYENTVTAEKADSPFLDAANYYQLFCANPALAARQPRCSQDHTEDSYGCMHILFVLPSAGATWLCAIKMCAKRHG